ncbi:hypothetical protein C5167_048820 [Papaver somniferum]|uniref:Uncharacterized protein n=1 Tax=Papaver somniferum TaxID=3469 RepID=A0A4Y7KML3_PAPSO|nr:hypothetical protein C5167_048820 [Papaver somniferum]
MEKDKLICDMERCRKISDPQQSLMMASCRKILDAGFVVDL